jgi:hypothetical protein
VSRSGIIEGIELPAKPWARKEHPTFSAKPKNEPSAKRPPVARGAAEKRPSPPVNPVWSRLALAPGATRRQGAAASGNPAAGGTVVQRKPIKDTPLASKLKSFTMKQGPAPDIGRAPSQNPDKIILGMSDYLKVDATAQFTSQADVANLEFGFFQLGRPYELYRATMKKIGADPAAANQDLNLDLTSKMRSELPQLDHTIGARFYESNKLAMSTKADANGKVQLKYTDKLKTIFDTGIKKDGSAYELSGIAAQSFLFAAFGAWDGTDATILGTFYWDLKHCEAIPPGDHANTKSFGKVNVAPVRDCAQGGCDLGEPMADQFGQPAKKSYNGVVYAATEDFATGALGNPKSYDGPGTFSIGCGAAQGKAKKGEKD